jgi:hypothetical protein
VVSALYAAIRGVGDLLDLGFQADHVRVDLAEADAGGDGGRGVGGGVEFSPGGLGRGVQGVEHLAGDGDRLAGRGLRSAAGLALAGC